MSGLIVVATIVRDNEVLLVKHASDRKPDYGYWLLPGGRVEIGESLEEALRREVGEELGLSVEMVRKLLEHIDPYTGDKLSNFLCSAINSETRISAELKEARWFKRSEIKETKEIHPHLRQFLINLLKT